MASSLNGDSILLLDRGTGSNTAFVSSPHPKGAGLPIAACDCTSRPRSGSPGTIARPPAMMASLFETRMGVSVALEPPWLYRFCQRTWSEPSMAMCHAAPLNSPQIDDVDSGAGMLAMPLRKIAAPSARGRNDARTLPTSGALLSASLDRKGLAIAPAF